MEMHFCFLRGGMKGFKYRLNELHTLEINVYEIWYLFVECTGEKIISF
jgi:hypothetical protein